MTIDNRRFAPVDATQAVHTYLVSAPNSAFAGQPVEMLAHWQGSENLLWRVECRGREAVLKLFLDAGQVRSRRQFEAQLLFYPAGFACRPLWYDWQPEGLPRPVLVYDWVEGSELDLTDLTSVLETAKILASVHAAGVDDVGRLSPNPVSFDYFWRLQSRSIAQIDGWLAQSAPLAFRTQFRTLAEAATNLADQALSTEGSALPSAIHGDPKLANFVHADGIITLLDWERFGLGDPALDVATFLFQNQAGLDVSVRTDWLATYLDHASQTSLAQRIGLYQRLLPFQSVCFLLTGLQKLAADGDALVRYRDDLPFLRTTVAASLAQSAGLLKIHGDDFASSTSELFRQFGLMSAM